MTPALLPVFLDEEPAAAYHVQLAHLQRLAGDLVTWLPGRHVGDPVPAEASAVVVPDMNGRAYRMVEEFRRIDRPVLLVTSEFGTVSMWDWEIRDFLRRRGVPTVAPTSLEEFTDVCRALQTRLALAAGRMLAYQDDLGGGKQPDIFKRFFWWEDSCVEALTDTFGVTVERRSWRELAARAAAVSPARVAEHVARLGTSLPMVGVSTPARDAALQLYVALSDELDETPGVIAAGINCLNESATSNTTPCLAWNLLFEERGLMWGCEADLTSMITQYLTYESLRVPVMMSNLYPFLMGGAALQHERIPYFPDVEDPQDCVLAAHCGFFGVVPQSFATEWTVRPRVLEIVDPNAHALDARFATGATTILKLASTMDTVTLARAELADYAQYQDSDCLNGAVLRVEDGPRFVERLPSHHAVLATGDLSRRFEVVAGVLGLAVERI